MKYTVSVDFDGVLHRYETKWINAHTIPDSPVPGAIEWLHKIIQKFDVVIFSTRAKTWRGRRAMRAWLRRNSGMLYHDGMGWRGIEEVTFAKKPIALIYLDDRALRFEGRNWPSGEEIHRARPWNRRENKL